MNTALYRDKEGRVVFGFPFILVVDPILNQGAIYQDEVAVDDAYVDDDLMEDATPETILQLLAQRGNRIYYLRSEADLEDEILQYFAIADGQLQDTLAAVWLRQNMEFPGTEQVDWDNTTIRLYTDGERIICEGMQVTLLLPPDHPERAALDARVREFLTTYAQDVADDLRVELKHVPARAK